MKLAILLQSRFTYDYRMTDQRRKLHQTIHRRTKDWVAIYRPQPDSERLIRSLMQGVKAGIESRIGVPHDSCPRDGIWRAWVEGWHIGIGLPASLIDFRGDKQAVEAAP